MSYRYYDWASPTATSGTYWYDGASATTTTPIYYAITTKMVLVKPPSHWTREDGIAFVHLINAETRTGWVITMLIDGEILITDPNVETRTMEAFLPLLRRSAGRDDLAKINTFFEAHPLTPPTEEAA